jgi:polyhydroxyalkanoate synthesis regulator phasin
MEEILKKYIYTSVGIASIANDKLKELLEDLIQNNHFVEEEGERIVDQFFVNLRADIDTIQGSIQSKMDVILQKLHIASVQHLKDDIEKNVNNIKQNSALLLKGFSSNQHS